MEKGIHLILCDIVTKRVYEVQFDINLSLSENMELFCEMANISLPLFFHKKSGEYLDMNVALKDLDLFEHSYLSFF